MAYLDKTGLAYFWSKVKEKVNTMTAEPYKTGVNCVAGKYYTFNNKLYLCTKNTDGTITVTNTTYFTNTTVGEELKAKASVLDCYPVGAIYMSMENTSPASLFGGTWEQLQGRFLLGAGGGYVAGSTGGESTHTLTINEMPSHNHTIEKYFLNDGGTSGSTLFSKQYQGTDKTGYTGGSKPHNNMPPYLTVYMWKRTK